jgi:hypothetical protein
MARRYVVVTAMRMRDGQLSLAYWHAHGWASSPTIPVPFLLTPWPYVYLRVGDG